MMQSSVGEAYQARSLRADQELDILEVLRQTSLTRSDYPKPHGCLAAYHYIS